MGWDVWLLQWCNRAAASSATLYHLALFSSLWLPWLMAAVLLYLAVEQGRRADHFVLPLVLAIAFSWLACRELKALFSSSRPFVMGHATALLGHSPSAGFPSMHASVAFAVAVAMWRACPRHAPWKWALGLAAGLMAWSRMALGLHYPSDVLAGAVLGSAAGLLAHGLVRWSEHARDSRGDRKLGQSGV